MPDVSTPAPDVLEVRVSQSGERAVLALAGEFDLAAIEVVRSRFAEVRNDSPAQVVIDLSELTFIDSTGISFLLSAVRDDEEGRLSFVASPAPSVQRVFAITGVGELFGGLGSAPEGDLKKLAT